MLFTGVNKNSVSQKGHCFFSSALLRLKQNILFEYICKDNVFLRTYDRKRKVYLRLWEAKENTLKSREENNCYLKTVT